MDYARAKAVWSMMTDPSTAILESVKLIFFHNEDRRFQRYFTPRFDHYCARNLYGRILKDLTHRGVKYRWKRSSL
eukprot:1192122-Prorocentrum_minimum.AAC.1